jgi:hypothetical protein
MTSNTGEDLQSPSETRTAFDLHAFDRIDALDIVLRTFISATNTSLTTIPYASNNEDLNTNTPQPQRLNTRLHKSLGEHHTPARDRKDQGVFG